MKAERQVNKSLSKTMRRANKVDFSITIVVQNVRKLRTYSRRVHHFYGEK